MFKQFKNIDTAFRQMRLFSILIVSASFIVCIYSAYRSSVAVMNSQQRVFILANGKVMEAWSEDRKANIPVEARDHVKMFHYYFFTLDPDDKVIRSNITKALYLADNTAKKQYDNLKETGYYSGLISGNISQEISMDSISVGVTNYPYHFYCYATQRIIRPTSIVTRSLITEGVLRNVSRSDNNPHGFLIEHWQTLDNKDIKTENR